MMIIAMPISEGKLSSHFGRCEQFALFQVENETIRGRRDMDPPPHEPGLLPRWLKDNGVELVITGGMGRRAQNFFTAAGIEIICGAEPRNPEEILGRYLSGSLEPTENACDHQGGASLRRDRHCRE